MDILSIGRAADNDIQVGVDEISAHHAVLKRVDGALFIEDLDSTNGTTVNGAPISTARITPGDEIVLGGVYRLDLDHPKVFSWLRGSSGRTGSPVPESRSDSFTIGRSPGCDLVVQSEYVSSEHARLYREGDALFVEDLGSRNGTFVNGVRIQRAMVSPGDRVSLSQNWNLDWSDPRLVEWLQGEEKKSRPFAPIWAVVGGVALVLLVVGGLWIGGVFDGEDHGTVVSGGTESSGYIQEALTGADGTVSFADEDGGSVRVLVVDPDDMPMERVRVGYYRTEDCGLFLASDTRFRYPPAARAVEPGVGCTIQLDSPEPVVEVVEGATPERWAGIDALQGVEAEWNRIGPASAEGLARSGKTIVSMLNPPEPADAERLYSVSGNSGEIGGALRYVTHPDGYDLYEISESFTRDSVFFAIPSSWSSPEMSVGSFEAEASLKRDAAPGSLVVHVYAVTPGMVPLRFEDSAVSVQEEQGGGWREVPADVAFYGELDLPVTVGFAMDYSGSMSDGDIADMERAVSRFLGMMDLNDKATLVKFSTEVQRVAGICTPGEAGLMVDHSWHGEGERTALYDAVWTVCQSSRLNAAVVLTDGQENESSRSLGHVTGRASSMGIPVFTIGLGSEIDEGTLNSIASSTGGQYFHSPSSGQLQRIYDSIGNVISSTYRIAWSPGYGDEARIIVSLFGQYETYRDTLLVSY